MVNTTPVSPTVDALNEVLRRGKEIDESDFTVLYRHYQPSLTRYAAKRGVTDAEGAADLAMFDGYKALNRGSLRDRSEPAFRSYLYKAVESHIANEHRKTAPDTTELDDNIPLDEDHAEDAVDSLWIQSLLDELTDGQRETIYGRFLLDLDAKEVGRRLDKDPNAVHQLQHRALRRLRNLILAVALIIGGIFGVLAVRQVLSTSLNVDTTPIDQPDTPPTTANGNARGPATTPERIDRAPETDEPGPLESPSTQSTADSAPTTEAPATTTTLTDTPVTATSLADASPTTASTPTETTATIANANPVETTAAAGEATVFPLNSCQSSQIGADLASFSLYVVGDNPQLAAVFTAPAAVRFTDSAGTVLHTIDTSGTMASGLTPDTHGWLGSGDLTGTHADYAQAPRPTYWGVLATRDATSGWTAIQYRLPATTVWLDTFACP